jgi:hypothetical protein
MDVAGTGRGKTSSRPACDKDPESDRPGPMVQPADLDSTFAMVVVTKKTSLDEWNSPDG